jgi:hypothetical protein
MTWMSREPAVWPRRGGRLENQAPVLRIDGCDGGGSGERWCGLRGQEGFGWVGVSDVPANCGSRQTRAEIRRRSCHFRRSWAHHPRKGGVNRWVQRRVVGPVLSWGGSGTCRAGRGPGSQPRATGPAPQDRGNLDASPPEMACHRPRSRGRQRAPGRPEPGNQPAGNRPAPQVQGILDASPPDGSVAPWLEDVDGVAGHRKWRAIAQGLAASRRRCTGGKRAANRGQFPLSAGPRAAGLARQVSRRWPRARQASRRRPRAADRFPRPGATGLASGQGSVGNDPDCQVLPGRSTPHSVDGRISSNGRAHDGPEQEA